MQRGTSPGHGNAQCKGKKRWTTIARIVLGILFLILGVLGLFLPVLQGLLFLAAGMALLADHVPLVARWKSAFLRRFPRLMIGMQRLRRMAKTRTCKSSNTQDR